MVARRTTPDTRIGRRRLGLARVGRFSTRSGVLLASVVAILWLLVVFGSALARVEAANREMAIVQAENAALQAEVDAGDVEIRLIQTDAFLSLEARTYAMGTAAERLFALQLGSPDPQHIVPLGTREAAPAAAGPLEEWLQLLFG